MDLSQINMIEYSFFKRRINGGRWAYEPFGRQSVIEAAYSLIKLEQVKSAESLLNPFTSELA